MSHILSYTIFFVFLELTFVIVIIGLVFSLPINCSSPDYPLEV